MVSAAWINWFNAILFALLLVLELALMPETLYPRNLMLGNNSKGDDGISEAEKGQQAVVLSSTATLRRTKTLFFINLVPIPGIQQHARPYDALVRFVFTFPFLVVSVGVLGYCFLWYWWVLSVVTMMPSAYAQYSPLIQGLLFLGLFLGTLFSEILFSGSLSDYIVARLTERNGGTRVPEMRLWLIYPAILLTGSELYMP